MNRTRHRALAAAAAVVTAGAATIAVLAAGPAEAQTPTSPTSPTAASVAGPRSIVVTGSGRVSERPDTVTIVIGVETTSVRAKDALTANSQAAGRVIDLVKDRGVAAADIQTANLSISPRFDDRGRRVTGYVVNNTVSVRIRGIDKAGPIVDAAADLAGDSIRIQGIGFSIANPAPLAKKAREAAVKDGREQAEVVAAAAGEKLGRLRLIRVVDQGFPVPVALDMAATRNVTAEVPIQAGSLDVTSQVELVYELL
jgi:hypothetical protein